MSLALQFSRVRTMVLERFHLGAGVVSTIGIRVICAALSYLMFIAIGRTSSILDFRDFAFVFTAIGFCGPLAALGSQQTVFKYLPMLIHHDDAERFVFGRHVFKIVARGIVIFSVIACVLIGHGVTQHLTWQFYGVIVLITALGALCEILSSFYTVMGSVVMSVAIREMLWRVILIAGVLILYWISGPVSLMEISLMFLLSYVGMLAAFTVKLGDWLKQVWHATGTLVMDIPRRQFWSFFGLAVVGLTIIHLDTMILGLAQQSTSLGAFFSAQRTTQVLLFFGQSVGIFAGPIVSKSFALGQHEEITRFSRRTILFAGGPTVILAIGIALMAGPIMGLFRPEFVQYAVLLQILLLSPLILTVGGLHTIIPTYCGGEHVYLNWRIVLIVVMIPVKIAVAVWGGPLQFAVVTVVDSLLITIMGLVISRVKCRVSAL